MGGFTPGGGTEDHTLLTNIGTNTHAQIDSYIDTATVSSGSVQYYADSAGDDSDGLSWATAKKTIQDALDIIPYNIYHDTTLNCRGTFSHTADIVINKVLHNDIKFIIDGGDNIAVVDDNSGSNYTADIGSTSTIGKTGSGWTIDAYAGYLVENVTTPEKRLIQAISTDTIIPQDNFSGDPTGDDFRIVKWSTIIQDDSSYESVKFQCRGSGDVYLQRCYLGNRAYIFIDDTNDCTIYISGCEVEMASGAFALQDFNKATTFLGDSLRDPSTYGLLSYKIGTSFLFPTAAITVGSTAAPHSCYVVGALFKNTLNLENAILYGCNHGPRFLKGIHALNSSFKNPIENSSGYAVTKISNSAGHGIELINSDIEIEDIDISDCLGAGSHGIDASGTSSVRMLAATTGSGNADHGVYVHRGGRVTTAPGITPTVTGVSGDVLENATTKAWAADTSYGEVYADEVAAGDSYAGHREDEPPSSPSAHDNEWNDGVIGTGWSWTNFGAGTPTGSESVNYDHGRVNIGITGSSATKSPHTTGHCLTKSAITSGTFDMWAKVRLMTRMPAITGVGLILMDSALNNGIYVALAPGPSMTNTAIHAGSRTAGAAWWQTEKLILSTKEIIVRIQYNCSTGAHKMTYHLDQTDIGDDAYPGTLLFTPAYMGMFIECNSPTSNITMAQFEWFRVTV